MLSGLPTYPMRFEKLLGFSPVMSVVYEQIEKAAGLKCSVLILGETGTGKELVAASIHSCGLRRHRPFVPVDCSALSPSLFETEMFGCERGAYTDARTNRKGLMESAEDGTLFLDEIGNLRVDLQIKLLRAIQQREVRPVGSNQWIPIQARLIAATNENLEDAVARGTFRQELLFRLNIIQIELPPLRRRQEDIPLLARFFVNKFSTQQGIDRSISPRGIAVLVSHSWPGNVRELQNVVERTLALEDGPVLEFSDFASEIDATEPSQSRQLQPAESLSTVKNRTIKEALNRFHGNKIAAARALGIGKTTLYRKLKECCSRDDVSVFNG